MSLVVYSKKIIKIIEIYIFNQLNFSFINLKIFLPNYLLSKYTFNLINLQFNVAKFNKLIGISSILDLY